MANISALTSAELIDLSDVTGFAQWEMEQFWTQELFNAIVANWKAGLITEQIVDPAQAGRPPSEVFFETFVEGVKKDLRKLFEAIPTLEELGTFTKLILAAVVIMGAVIVVKKMKG